MDKVVYICIGSCKAEIFEDQYKGGLTQCGTEGCNLKGHTFEKRIKCHICGNYYKEDKMHSH